MQGNVLQGKEFNELYKGKPFIKLTNKDEIHNGFKFKTGLNVDTVPFDPSSGCKPGGIYFCEFSNIVSWLDYNGTPNQYYRYVLIPRRFEGLHWKE
jgi:hypothetical protein